MIFKILFSTLLSLPALAQVKFIEGQYGVNTKQFTNYVKNVGCAKNTIGITASGGSLTRNTTSALEGGADCAIDASASGQTYTWATFTLDNWLAQQNCEASFVYKGDASLYKAYVNVNSVKTVQDLQLASSVSNPQPVSINFPCGAQPLTTNLVIESTSASAAAINVAKVYVGPATNLNNSAQPKFVGSIKWAGTASCLWTNSQTNTFTNFTAQASCPTPTVIGSLTAPGTKIPGFVINNAEPGNYLIFARLFAYGTSSTQLALRFSDGTNTSNPVTFYGSSTTLVSGGNVTGDISLTSAQSTWTVQLQGSTASAGTSNIDNQNTASSMEISVYKFQTSNQQILSPNTTPAFWSGYHDNTCGGWSVTSTSYADFSADASCVLVQRNASIITATTSGSVKPSISLTLPKVGTYFICASSAVVPAASSSGSWRLWDGTTVIGEANISTSSNTQTMLCGAYNATTLTPTISIQAKMASGATTINPGGTAIEWSVLDISQNINAPILVGSVISTSTGVERVERAVSNTNCTSSPCTLTTSTPGIAVTRTGTGAYVATFTPAYSAVPSCSGWSISQGNFVTVPYYDGGGTGSSISFHTIRPSTEVNFDSTFMITCVGPK